MYLLTVFECGQLTRLQMGCFNEITQKIVAYAAANGSFARLELIAPSQAPERDEAEIRRAQDLIFYALQTPVTH